MVSDQHKRRLDLSTLDIFDAENIHQIVGRDIDPERPDVPLAKRHHSLPNAEIHPVGQPKPYSFPAIQYADLRGFRH